VAVAPPPPHIIHPFHFLFTLMCIFFCVTTYILLHIVARDVLNELERKGKEKRKRREEWWYQQTENGKTKDALPVPDDAGIFYILKSTKVARIIGHFLNNSHTFQNIREVTWDRSDRLGRMYPTMLWFLSKANRENNMNKYLDRIAKVGLGLSLSMFLLGAANVPLLLSLWVCQRSLMSVGGPWYVRLYP
jgi:hypothetical protein